MSAEKWEPEELKGQNSFPYRDKLRAKLIKAAEAQRSLDSQIDQVVNNETALMSWSAQGCATASLEKYDHQAYREWSSIAVSLAKKSEVDR